MKYTLDHIAGIIGASLPTGQASLPVRQAGLPADQAGQPVSADLPIEYLLTDSRKVFAPAQTLFFALKGPRRNGLQFINELYKKGVRSFVISEALDETQYPAACFLKVADTLAALQSLAAYNR